jgi:hypothetical protein
MLVLTIGMLGIVMIVMPDLTTVIAQALGVGRGADLVMYVGGMGIAFVCLLLYSKLRVLESHFTALVRTQAIEHATSPTDDSDDTSHSVPPDEKRGRPDPPRRTRRAGSGGRGPVDGTEAGDREGSRPPA